MAISHGQIKPRGLPTLLIVEVSESFCLVIYGQAEVNGKKRTQAIGEVVRVLETTGLLASMAGEITMYSNFFVSFTGRLCYQNIVTGTAVGGRQAVTSGIAWSGHPNCLRT